MCPFQNIPSGDIWYPFTSYWWATPHFEKYLTTLQNIWIGTFCSKRSQNLKRSKKRKQDFYYSEFSECWFVKGLICLLPRRSCINHGYYDIQGHNTPSWLTFKILVTLDHDFYFVVNTGNLCDISYDITRPTHALLFLILNPGYFFFF